MASDPVRINNVMHGWGSIVAKFADERFYGFTSISYNDKLEGTPFSGQALHQAPIGRPPGKYSCDPCTVKFRKGSAAIFRQLLAQQAPDGRSFGTVEFDLIVQYLAAGDVPITDQVRRMRWTGNTASSEEGGDALMDEVTFQPLFIIWNGYTLFDSSQGMP